MNKKENIKQLKSKSGITLIALVVTIIVLIILAGVSISLVLGDNGIITKAKQGKENTEIAANEEEKQFSELLDEINDNLGVDWEYAKSIAVAPETQDEERNNGVIGIGTDGKPVDMDLWEYELDVKTGGYGLNDSTSLTTNASANASKGYLGTDFENIIIPQYIYTDETKEWKPVTNLDWTFFNCTELSEVEVIPSTVISMRFTLRGCKNFQNEDIKLPYGLKDLYGAFYECSKLTKTPIFPNTVENCGGTFSGCTSIIEVSNFPNELKNMYLMFNICESLTKVPNIPNKVEVMERTFEGCTSLENAPVIPNSVTNLIKTFYGCSKLTGIIEINANISGNKIVRFQDNTEQIDYIYLFKEATTAKGTSLKLTGDCKVLEDIVTATNNPNITVNN